MGDAFGSMGARSGRAQEHPSATSAGYTSVRFSTMEDALATDLRSGTDFPRRGRDEVDGFLWILRAFDKARAAANGTLYDYIYPCPMDKGVFERWGITAAEFDEAIVTRRTDHEILAWLRERVDAEHRDAANHWLTLDKAGNMDRQDREEGVVAA